MNTDQTLTEITRRRHNTGVALRVIANEVEDAGNDHQYTSALMKADSLIAEAKRLRQRVEWEKLAYERQQEDEQRQEAS